MQTSKRNQIIYWAVTVLIMLPTAGSGVVELFTSGPEQVAQSMRTLGYPLYIMKILGLGKMLGGIAILYGKYPRLKEWAYAGFTFDFLGATASHLLANDAEHAPPAFISFIVLAISYGLWRRLDKRLQVVTA